MKMDFNSSSQPEAPAHAAVSTPSTTLAGLLPGQRAIVTSVDGSGEAGRRLGDLGVLPETPVRVVRRAPMGDPVIYELRGYRLCLRATEARRVQVRIDSTADDDPRTRE